MKELEKVASLLHDFDRESISLAEGPALKGINPPWRQFNREIRWGTEPVKSALVMNAEDCLTESLKNNSEKIILVCLGPLTNIARFIKK